MFTKSILSIRIVAGLVLAAGLAACAHQQVAPEHGGMHHMDKDAMCAMYRNMQNASEQERHEMMERNMQNMSPEMRQQHMEMMQKQCQ
jgi:uncharacterized membrane protein (DUF106 family)